MMPEVSFSIIPYFFLCFKNSIVQLEKHTVAGIVIIIGTKALVSLIDFTMYNTRIKNTIIQVVINIKA